MKARGFAHAVLLIIMLVLVTLFLSAFIWTCFHQPISEDTPSLISVKPSVPEPSAVVVPSESEEQDKETREEPSLSEVVEREKVQAVPGTPPTGAASSEALTLIPSLPWFWLEICIHQDSLCPLIYERGYCKSSCA